MTAKTGLRIERSESHTGDLAGGSPYLDGGTVGHPGKRGPDQGPLAGLDAREQEKKRFFELAERLTRSTDADEQVRLKEELAHMTFGE